MPFIASPDVPASPGVPTIFREPDASSPSGPPKLKLPESWFDPPRWGLYTWDGTPVLVFDTFLGINFVHGGTVSTVPTEKQKMLVVDKVESAYQATIKLAHTGHKASRTAMLSDLERIVLGTELYDVVTPEFTYPSVNPVRYTYDRGEKNGATQLVVELTLLQVRRVKPEEASKAKDASGANTQNNGQTQPTDMGSAPPAGEKGKEPPDPVQ